MSRSMIGLLQLMLMVFILAYAKLRWANDDRGRAFFRLCAGCHGSQGEGRFDFGAPAIAGLPEWSGIKQDLPPADETIRVIGHQWSWRFVHPGVDRQLGTADDIETIDALHLQEGTLYHFHLEAADVLHSFSIPAFRLKQYAVPGRMITGWFKPTRTGIFAI